MDQGRYEQVATLWHNVRDFTHIYGFWSDRLGLLDWQIIEAENRRDYSMLVQLMFDKAFTLTLTGPSSRLEYANSLLRRCWSLRENVSLVLQARVTALTASLCIKHHEHTEAHQWLDKSEQLLYEADIDPIERARERASMLFDRGENYLVAGEYTQAQAIFEDMLAQAEISGWQRTILHAQNWLAYTSLQQKDHTASKEHLQAGWIVAQRIKERRLSAFFQRSYAYYYREIGDRAEALEWAKNALDSFERLGMPPDIEEMQTLLKDLKADTIVS
jgi:tetratricopeptide (TPR) repeat protein